MRLVDVDEIKLPHGFFEKVDNVPKFYEWLGTLPTVDVDSLNAKHEDIGYEKGYRDGYAEALNVTDNAEPVRHGHWLFYEEPDGYYHSECSECGQWCDEDVFLKGKWHYCPNCGAKMDGERREDGDSN